MEYPTMQQVKAADRIQLARWYRFLPAASTPEQVKIVDQICFEFEEVGGMTPAVSKQIGMVEQ